MKWYYIDKLICKIIILTKLEDDYTYNALNDYENDSLQFCEKLTLTGL